MKYLKNHWFGILISVFMAYFLTVIILVVISPKEDAKNRGFIPCSDTQMQNIKNCKKNRITCIICSSLQGNLCYMKVVNKGMVDFLLGRQTFPWSNYLFSPEPEPAEYQDEEVQKILQEHPELIKSMEDIKEKNRILMEKINNNQEDNVNG